MSQVATAMAKKADREYCTYRAAKIDDQLLDLLRIAAIEEHTSAAEIISEAVNLWLAKRKGVVGGVIKRRRPPPRGPRKPPP